MADIEVDGWRIFLHPCFLDQYERLLSETESARAADPDGYRRRRCTKMLAAVRKVAFETVPANPSDPSFRLGSTLGSIRKHWFRAKFLQQYRLFFRYSERAKIIVIAWVNDEATKRAYGSSSDAYAVFRAMLGKDRPPDDWDRLVAECEKAANRARRLASRRVGDP